MEIHKLKAIRGWIWVTHGYMLIMRNPMLVMIASTTAAVMILSLLVIPMVGPLLALLLMPVMIAGFGRICRALEEEETIRRQQFFSDLRKHVPRLVALGGLLLAGLLLASLVTISVGGEALSTLVENIHNGDETDALASAMFAGGSNVSLSLLIGFSLTFALMMAFQYAPMLVFFSGLGPYAAMRTSLVGSLRNFIPYTLYSIIMQVIAFALGYLPFNLGMIFLLPLAFCSLYVGYRNIFPFPGEMDTVHAAANDAGTNSDGGAPSA